jgi:cbb3-type cytochrome oxidase subunit 1
MPRLSVWFIRASLVYLVLGFTFGGLILFQKGIPFLPSLWRLLPAHIEFLLFGWTVQLVMGMAFWILPRFSKSPVRGNEKLAWGAFVLINAGVLALALSGLCANSSWLSLLGRLAEALGVLLFAAHAWPRVK